MTPRKPDGSGADRHVLADEARRAAADMCLAMLRLQAAMNEPNWRPGIITGPLLKDLTDIRHQLGALLDETEAM